MFSCPVIYPSSTPFLIFISKSRQLRLLNFLCCQLFYSPSPLKKSSYGLRLCSISYSLCKGLWLPVVIPLLVHHKKCSAEEWTLPQYSSGKKILILSLVKRTLSSKSAEKENLQPLETLSTIRSQNPFYGCINVSVLLNNSFRVSSEVSLLVFSPV